MLAWSWMPLNKKPDRISKSQSCRKWMGIKESKYSSITSEALRVPCSKTAPVSNKSFFLTEVIDNEEILSVVDFLSSGEIGTVNEHIGQPGL
jgi:hypothetical protein